MKTGWKLFTLGIAGLCAVGQVAWTKTVSKEVSCRVELDRQVLPAGKAQTAVIKVTLDAPQPPADQKRPPINLAIVLDRSGSMSGTKIEKAKEAAIEALRRLGPRDIFSLVIYDTNIETIVPAQSARNIEHIESRIKSIRPGGNTALFGGVSQGAAEIRKHLKKEYVHRLILLSDGLANVGPNSPEDLGRLGAALLKEEISVTTVGVGNDFNEDLMTQLSQKSDGNSYFVESSVDLPRIFAAELGDVLSVVARKVILEIECPQGTRPLRIIGRDGRIRKNTVQLNLNQLYGGQAKYVLIEVEVPAGTDKQTLKIAEARCSYENALTLKSSKSVASVSASFSRSEKEVIASANVTVQEELVYNRVAITKDKAVELWDAGRKDEAIEVLKKSAAVNELASQQYKLAPKALKEAQQLTLEADELEKRGLSKNQRKVLRYDSYSVRNQQRVK